MYFIQTRWNLLKEAYCHSIHHGIWSFRFDLLIVRKRPHWNNCLRWSRNLFARMSRPLFEESTYRFFSKLPIFVVCIDYLQQTRSLFIQESACIYTFVYILSTCAFIKILAETRVDVLKRSEKGKIYNNKKIVCHRDQKVI